MALTYFLTCFVKNSTTKDIIPKSPNGKTKKQKTTQRKTKNVECLPRTCAYNCVLVSVFLCVSLFSNGNIISGVIHGMGKTRFREGNRVVTMQATMLLFPPLQAPCRAELQRALDRLASNTRTHEDLYSFPIPNCDKNGDFHTKQVCNLKLIRSTF